LPPPQVMPIYASMQLHWKALYMRLFVYKIIAATGVVFVIPFVNPLLIPAHVDIILMIKIKD
jgi:hypothetical protein